VRMLPPIVSIQRERVKMLPPIVSIQRVEDENVTSYCEYPEGRE
jgi:hypothetical protein